MSSSSVADTIKLNFNGFSTRVLINGEPVSATDVSITSTENILHFDGAYCGPMNYSSDDQKNFFRMNSMGLYELPEISCSIGVELTYPQLKTLFLNFLKNRGQNIKLQINTGHSNKNVFEYSNCFLKSLNISATQGGLLSSKYEFYVSPLFSNINNSKFFNNPINNNVQSNNVDYKPIFTMSKKNLDDYPIGFWETQISGFEGIVSGKTTSKQVLDWSLTFSQNIITKYHCNGFSYNQPPPPYIMIGSSKLELNVDFIIDKNNFDENVFAVIQPHNIGKKYNNRFQKKDGNTIGYPISDSSGVSLYVRGNQICKFLHGFVTTYSPTLTSSGAVIFNTNYLINEISIPKNDPNTGTGPDDGTSTGPGDGGINN